jgi:hypothetical protein
MSRPTPHLCSFPGCATVLPDGPGRCGNHGRPARHGTDGYTHRWAKLSRAYRREHPRCEALLPNGLPCGKPVADVHHRDFGGPGSPRFFDWANLQSLCRSHHREVTEHHARDMREREASANGQRLAHLKRRSAPPSETIAARSTPLRETLPQLGQRAQLGTSARRR